MAQITDLAPVPPPQGGDNKVTMSREIAALIECHMRDANAFDDSAMRMEAESRNAQTTPAYTQFAASKAYDYRHAANYEIGAIATLLRQQFPHASLEQRCDYLQANTSLTPDDVNRVWNAFQAGY